MPDQPMDPKQRRDRCITLYGRRAVIEALEDKSLDVVEVIVAEGRGSASKAVLDAARKRGVPFRTESAHRVSLISGNGKHDQGVVADLRVPQMVALSDRLAELEVDRQATQRLLVLDGITTPANVGMVLRSVTAAGIDGVVVPRRGTAELGPLVIKASAGTAFRAPILRSPDALTALSDLGDAGFVIAGLDAEGSSSLFEYELPKRVAFLMGSETHGPSEAASQFVHEWVSIPMPGDVESLNVACAATLVAFEVSRRA